MGATLSGDGIIIGADIDIGRIQQAVNKMKSLMEDFAGGTSAAVQKADKELEKARKNAEKWKIEPTTDGIEAATRELDRLNATIVNQQAELANCEFEELMRFLDEKYRTVLLLYYGEGFKVTEIAQILDMEENTVKSRLSRGREKFRQIWTAQNAATE